MKKQIIVTLLLFSLIAVNCTKKEKENLPLNVEINDFVWKGLNTYYLWQDSVPTLSDTRFATQENLYTFLEDYDNPEDLFESLKYRPEDRDKWSWIVDDYVALEEYFSGVRKTTGAKLKFYLTAENSSQIFGVVRYIVPDTDAASKPIERGAVFRSVNGTNLNTSNYKDLIYNADSYTLNLGTYFYNDTTEAVEVTPLGIDVNLVKGVYNENPVYNQSVFEVNGSNVGYLLYNSFTSNYDTDLNNAFQYFQSENITDLILDLRYNGGGSVQTAIYLSSMITGQFEGEIFTKEKWNSKWQEWLETNHPDWLVNHFTNTMADGTALNSLNLNRVIIITTGDSASASELVINALKPYIDVVTIGTTTHGKYVASVTLYDSDNFSRENANPDHTWAMQPIVLKEVNSLGNYAPGGFPPSIQINENLANMGIIGTATEYMTARAIQYIINGNKSNLENLPQDKITPITTISNRLENEMYIESELPFERL